MSSGVDLSELTLPSGWRWIKRGGDYWHFEHENGARGAIGGLACKCSNESEWPGILKRAIIKADIEHQRDLGWVPASADDMSNHIREAAERHFS